tara:strand:- start:220 stop:687 length:468 start_codon:yes stop_codon:yes gene_type:complete
MRHIISVKLENESGALSRVANLFSARNFNIESLSVAPTNNPSSSIMTIVTSGNDHVIEQIIKQLSKIIDVLDVVDITSSDHIEKQVLLIKLDSNEYQKIKGNDFLNDKSINIYEKSTSIVIELCSSPKEIDEILHNIGNIEYEIVRSGTVGINNN